MQNSKALTYAFAVIFFLSFIYSRITDVEQKVYNAGVILITGASTGIGYDAALKLANIGFTVFAGVRKTTDFDRIVDLKIPRLNPIIIDVTNHDSCVEAIENIKLSSQKMRLNFIGLINNAGIGRLSVAEFHNVNDAKAIFNTNFFGMLDITQLSLPSLRASEGRIIMISSLAGLVGMYFTIVAEVYYEIHNYFIIIIRQS